MGITDAQIGQAIDALVKIANRPYTISEASDAKLFVWFCAALAGLLIYIWQDLKYTYRTDKVTTKHDIDVLYSETRRLDAKIDDKHLKLMEDMKECKDKCCG